MKKQIMSTVFMAAAVFMIAGCEQFEDSYDRIEDTEFRLLDFMYERAEGGMGTGSADIAPGDTMLLTAVFSGKPVDLDTHIREWWISFNAISDIFGSVTVADSVRIDGIEGVRMYPYDFSANTQAVRFEIPIREDMMKTSAAIPNGTVGGGFPEWWTMFATDTDNLRTLIEEYPQVALMSKTQIIDALASFTQGNAVDNEFLHILLQYFTVPVRVWAKIRQEPGRLPHTIRSDHSIRYNNRVNKAVAGRVPENNIPKISHIAAYKIRGEISSKTAFDNRSGLDYDSIPPNANGKLVIPVESGYSYYLEAVAHDNSNDFTITMYGNLMPEEHDSYWHYRLNDAELNGVKHADHMNIIYNTGYLTPPANRRIRNFVFWATVTDNMPNERLRPQGGTLVEVEGCFAYDGETSC